MIRAVPSNASDNVCCTLLAQSAVHGVMAGYNGFTVGLVNGRHTYIPFYVSLRAPNQYHHQINIHFWISLTLIMVWILCRGSLRNRTRWWSLIECGQGFCLLQTSLVSWSTMITTSQTIQVVKQVPWTGEQIIYLRKKVMFLYFDRSFSKCFIIFLKTKTRDNTFPPLEKVHTVIIVIIMY